MRLRQLNLTDAPLMLEWMHDPSVVENLQANFAAKTLSDCEGFIRSCADASENLHMAIADENDEYMGTVSLKNIDQARKSAEFAISMRRCAMGTGLAQFGMVQIIRLGLEELGLRQVYWCVSQSNTRAVRFYDKSGYSRVPEEAIQVADVRAKWQLPDLLYYAVNKQTEENFMAQTPASMGANCTIGKNVVFGENVVLGHNCIIEDNVSLGDNVYVDSNTIIRSEVTLGADSFVGANCIIGEYLMDFCIDRKYHSHPLTIGSNALIRSGSIIYGDSAIGDHFQTGHQVTIREKARIGSHVSVGTLSDIQGDCDIGNYVRMHSNVHIGQLSRVDDFVWIFPYVVLTNDPTPPSENFVGVHIQSFAIVATGALIMPGIEIGHDSLVAAGAIITKPVAPYAVVAGNPGKILSDVRNVKNKITGEPVYPWRHHFKRAMPWSESDFDTWYRSLELEEKKQYTLECLEEK